MTTALCDFTGTYEGFPWTGFQRTPAQLAAGLAAASQVQPLDANGNPSPTGLIGVIWIGQSNAEMISLTGGSTSQPAFAALYNGDAAKNPKVVFVSCAQGGAVIIDWLQPGPTWKAAQAAIKAAGLTIKQIQVIIQEDCDYRPGVTFPPPGFPAAAANYQNELISLFAVASASLPNLKQIFVIPREGAATTDISTPNPEPYAYENGFACQWAVIQQTALGGVWVSIGPYFWCDGLNPRSDGQISIPYSMANADLRADQTHPSDPCGANKWAMQALAWIKTDPCATPWSLAQTSNPPPLVVAPTTASIMAGMSLNFQAMGVLSAYWNFDDGTQTQGLIVSKTFPVAGQFTVVCTGQDGAGNATSQVIPVVVS